MFGAFMICSDLCAFVAMLAVCVLYSARSGVNSVHVVLSGLGMRLLSFVHVCICCRFSCMYALAAFFLVCVDVRIM